MKKLVIIFITIALTGLTSLISAQELSDEALSAKYKQEIAVLASEIKTVKLKLKADKDNTALKEELSDKEAQYKDLVAKKKVIDKSIKSVKAAEKAEKKAEKAKSDAEKAAIDARKVKEKEKAAAAKKD
ncbi:MAG: hypothetical protein LBR18_06865 [Tannerella sp.]|jgi:hypothetical protein|nr:hypothetical protein [Tannerella sp.]